MADTDENDDDDVLEAMFVITSAVSAAVLITSFADDAAKHRRRRKHRVWVNKYLRRRERYGAYNSLMRDLLELDNVKFCNYVRMSPDDFEELFIKVQPFITTKDTRFRYVLNP